MEGEEIINPNEEGIAIPQEILDELNPEEGNEEETVEETEETSENEDTTEETVEEEVSEEQEDVEDDTEEDFKDKASLLKALNSERKKRKEAEKQLKTTVVEEKVDKSTYDSLVESGIDSDIAKTIAKVVEKPMQEVAKIRYEKDILQMSKRPGFEDVEEYADEMRPLINKGLTFEQAYYAISGGKKTINTKREVEREIEAKLKNNKAKQKIVDVDSKSTAPEVKEKKAHYSKEQIAVANAAGMSIEEYVAFSNMSSAKDYEKYKNK